MARKRVRPASGYTGFVDAQGRPTLVPNRRARPDQRAPRRTGPPLDLAEVDYPHPKGLRYRYRRRDAFDRWFAAWRGRNPFRDSLLRNPRIPRGENRPPDAAFFAELFMATQYLEAGYEALLIHHSPRESPDPEVDEIAHRLIGDAFASILRPSGGELGLLVYKPGKDGFRFVACMGPKEPFTADHIEWLARIPDRLRESPPPRPAPLGDPGRPDLFPALRPGEWLHVVRVFEDSQ